MGALIALASDLPTAAQLPPRIERCLPYPTLAQEIDQMRSETEAALAKPTKEVRIARIEFQNKMSLPIALEDAISSDLRKHSMRWSEDSDTEEDLNEMAEVGVRGVLQENGFFRPVVDVHLGDLRERADHYEISLIVFTDTGPQYRPKEINFEPADSRQSLAFSAVLLRGLVPLQNGQVLDTSKIRDGLRQITMAYGQLGFIDATTQPDFSIDDASHVISLILRIDEQKPYRVGSIEILGPGNEIKERLLGGLPKPGEIMDTTRLHKFFEENRKLLPPDASEAQDLKLRRGTRNGVVDIQLDLRTCPTGPYQAAPL